MKKLTLVFFLSFLLITAAKAEDLTFELPLPAGSTLTEQKDFTYGGKEIHAAVYQSRQKKAALVEYFISTLKQSGFEQVPLKEQVPGLFKFSKGSLRINLAVWEESGQAKFTIGKYLLAAGEADLEDRTPSFKDSLFAPPKEDAAGTTDLAAVPRPPKSVRWSNYSISGSSLLVYASRQSIAELSGFYRTKMPYLGWSLVNEFSSADVVRDYKAYLGKKDLGLSLPIEGGENLEEIVASAYVLDFLKADKARVRITIFPNFTDKKQGNIVQISYYGR